jgi:hypothetical protein
VAFGMSGSFAKEVCFDDSCYNPVTAIIWPNDAT